MKNSEKSWITKIEKKIDSHLEGKKQRKSYIEKILCPRNNLRLSSEKIKTYSIESFDTETTGRGNYFYLFGYMDKNGNYEHFFNKNDSINKILTQKHRLNLLYATNLGFDFNCLSEGTDWKHKCDVLIRSGNYIIVKTRGTYTEIKMLDSVNYGGLSVESMGKILKMPKLKKPRCLGKKPRSKKELEELIIYNKRDCEITREFMILFQKTLNLLGGELKSTISSSALDLFRRKFLKIDVCREKLILGYDIKDKIYKAYYGGRTEVFSRGSIGNFWNKKQKNIPKEYDDSKYFYGDINSLYPSVMLNEFPNPMSVKVNEHPDLEEQKDILKYEGVSYFELDIPFTKYPLLPYRSKEGKLLFPYGKLKGYYTHLEIRRQKELFPDTKIFVMKDCVYYTKNYKFFEDYVNTLYSLRQKWKAEGSELEVCAKLLLNSLYGRFALRTSDETIFFDFTNTDEAKKKFLECEKQGIRLKLNSANEGYYSIKKDIDGVASFPIWSVYTTAYARIKIHEYIVKYESIYVDTDSIITRKEVIDSKVLGKLKLEKIIKNGLIIKPKLYFLNDEIKSKGVPIPRDADKGKEFIKREKLKDNLLKGKMINYSKFIKIKEGITRDIKVNSIILASKKLSLEDNKRNWKGKFFNPDELQESIPLEIKENEE